MYRSMAMPVRVATLLLSCWFGSSLRANCDADATYFWLSPFAAAPYFADVPLVNSADSTSLYLWGRLRDGETVTDLSLDMVSSTPITIEAAVLENPQLGMDGDKPAVRFEHTPDAKVEASTVKLQGFSVGQRIAVGNGLGAATHAVDPFYDADSHAWRIGSVTFSSATASELALQVGVNGIQGVNANGDNTPEFLVVFGDRDDAPLCAIDQRGVSSSRHDARTSSGTVNTKAVGTLPGSYLQGRSARLQLEIGTQPAPWTIASGAKLSGILELNSAGYEDPIANGAVQRLTLVTADRVMGEFDMLVVDGQTLDGGFPAHHENGLFRSLDYGAGQVSLTNYRALIGDLDGDFEVGFTDFLIQAENFGGPGDWPEGDLTGDGSVQFTDFLLLSENYGSSVQPPQAKAVPEPDGHWLWVCGVLLLLPLAHDRR